MVYKLYKKYVHPLVRVVRGLPISWGPNFATIKYNGFVRTVAWSSCSRFIAVAAQTITGTKVLTEVLDAATFERLHTFMHSSANTVCSACLSFSPGGHSLTRISNNDIVFTAWDLQTGGQISAIPSALDTPSSFYFSSVHSMDGKIVAVAFECVGGSAVTGISTYNLISGIRIYSHRASEGRIIAPIWTRGEFLRFATMKPGSITIWEIGFTSEHTLAEIESLPAPDHTGFHRHRLFLPTLSRLAFILEEAVLIWDARDSKFLLNFMSGGRPSGVSFSSDGRFFACGVFGQGVHLWKESPAGYILHKKLVPSGPEHNVITLFLSPDGESIITSRAGETQLWRTTDPINPPSSVPPQPAEKIDFVLAFSPDKSFIATGRLGGNIATILDLKSGDPRLVINTCMRIFDLGVTRSTAIVASEWKIITWNLPTGDCVLDARANIHDSVRITALNRPPLLPTHLYSASISPDLNHLIVTMENGLDIYDVYIYDVSTGRQLAHSTTVRFMSTPWFTRDGREVWDPSCGQKIIRGGGSDVIGLEPIGNGDGPSGGYLWESSYGHKVTDDGWILDSRGKRVMRLPPHWRVSEWYRIWDERFLALFDPGLPEPVIIELYE